MIITILLLTGLVLTFKTWSKYVFMALAIPFMPFVIAFSIKNEKPTMAYSLLILWTLVYALSILFYSVLF